MSCDLGFELHNQNTCPGPDIDPEDDAYHQARSPEGGPSNGWGCQVCKAVWVLNIHGTKWVWERVSPESQAYTNQRWQEYFEVHGD